MIQTFSPATAAPLVKHFIQPHRHALRRKAVNQFWLIFTLAMTVLALVPLFWIIGYVIYRGLPAINLAFFTQLPASMAGGGGGVLHAIEGTILLAALASIFAAIPGVLAGFYAATHPHTPLGVAVRFGTDVLAGVPSIVVGLFGYALIVQPSGHYSALAGGVALAIIMLPTIVRTTEEMIKLVPGSLREGSLALGAPEWKTAIKVTVPAALSGIATGFMLALARASGETAPLLFTALGNDNFEIGHMVTNGLRSGQSLPSAIANIIQQPVDSLPLTLFKYTQQPFPERINQAWGVALVLIALILITNIAARLWIRSRTISFRG